MQNRLRLLPEPRYIPLLTLLVAKLVVVDVVSCRIGGCRGGRADAVMICFSVDHDEETIREVLKEFVNESMNVSKNIFLDKKITRL